MSGARARFPDVWETIAAHPMPAWQSATRCIGSARPGARALMAYWIESAEPLARSMGIYNCRSVVGGSSFSVHSEGRACDLGIPVTRDGHRVMYAFLSRLLGHCTRLGIPYTIFNGWQWSASRPSTGALYRGTHPHHDHAHVELTRTAGETLNLTTLRTVAGDLRGGITGGDDMFCKHGDGPNDPKVEAMQRLVAACGGDLGQWGSDGHYGDATASALQAVLGLGSPVKTYGPHNYARLQIAVAKRFAGEGGGLTQAAADVRYARTGATVNLGSVKLP